MATEQHKGYPAEKYPLEFMTGKAIVNLAFLFYDVDINGVETAKDFTGQTDCTFKIWEDCEDGRLLLSVSELTGGITTAGNIKTLNTSDSQMQIERGKYYYEFAYYIGGYEITLMFTEVKMV